MAYSPLQHLSFSNIWLPTIIASGFRIINSDDESFRRWFELAGDSLKRPPRGYDKEHPLIDDLKRKDFIAISELVPVLVEQHDFADLSCEYFAAATPLMQFLCKAMRVPF